MIELFWWVVRNENKVRKSLFVNYLQFQRHFLKYALTHPLAIKDFNVCQILLMSKFWPVLDHSSHVLFSKYIFCVSNQSSCSAISKKYSLKKKFMVLNEIQRFLLGLSRLYIQAQIIFKVPREEDSIILNLYQSSLCSTSIWTLGYLISCDQGAISYSRYLQKYNMF